MCAFEPEIRALGATLVGIGNGQPWQAAAFRDAAEIGFGLFVDPSRRSYRAAGLRRGWIRVLDLRVFVSAWRAHRTGARQTAVAGDPWQLGGVLVFSAAGRVVWQHTDRFPGDHARPADILAALRAQPAHG